MNLGIKNILHDRTCRLLLGLICLCMAFLAGSLALGKQIHIQADGKEYTVFQLRGTVTDALALANVTLSGTDRVHPSLSSRLRDGERITVTRVKIKEFTNHQVTQFALEKKEDWNLFPGEQKVIKEGKTGMVRHYYKVVYWDNQEKHRQLVKKEVLKKPEPMIVAYGPPIIPSRNMTRTENLEELSSGKYTRVIQASSTAYTHTGYRTATGVKPYRGVVSVDPRVIPLGTKLYVENYGPAVAMDTGGDIKGNRIDVFFETRQEALSWGRRQVKVHILE